MQKIIHIVLALTFLSTASLAQESSMFADSVIYATPEDVAFMRDKDTRFLFKAGTDFGLELKMGKALSFTAELAPDFLNNRINLTLDSTITIGAGLGARYYYKMANRIKAGKQANNMSGEYVGLSAGLGFAFNYASAIDTLDLGKTTGYSLSIGNQQRYLDFEYFDFSLNLDYTTLTLENDISFSTITLRTESAYGLALGRRHNIDKSALCPVIKCYENRKSGFKINRNNFFSLSRSTNNENQDVRWSLDLNPRIGYEFKLGDSPFSIAQDLRTNFLFSNFEDGKVSSFGLERTKYSYALSGRYYFNMSRKILSGEQGNNLSGGYVQALFKHKYDSGRLTNKNSGSVMAGIGRQNEIVNNIYMDISLATGFQIYNDFSLDLDLDFTIGYMF